MNTAVKETPFFDAFDRVASDINRAIEALEKLKSRIEDVEISGSTPDCEDWNTDRSDAIQEFIDALQSVIDYGGDDLDE
jgi:phosphoglucomutase